jgi:amino acid permease
MKGLIVLWLAGLQSLWHVTTANNYTNKMMLYDALEQRTQTMHHVKPMAVLSYLFQFYLVLWLFLGCYGNNLPFYSHTLKAAPLATMHHQDAISGRSLLTSVETGFCHHGE